jgi:deazaflavin-dependent oxidoreductase (nitroreductase family)
MATLSPETENNLRQVFKRFNPFMVGFFRLGLGWMVNIWPAVGGRIMVITHTGRKSGLRRRTPVNYAPINGDVYCTAGFGAMSDWYRNIMADPEVEVWLPSEWRRGNAEDISQDLRRLPLLRQVIIASGVVGPMVGVNPRTMSDLDFDQVTAKYRLVRIRLGEKLSGPGGPGDLAWVWLPLALIVALFLVRGRRQK